MYHQFRYALLLLTLALFGFALLTYSQDTIEQPNEEPNFAGQLNEEPNSSETQLKNLEDRLDVLQRQLNATNAFFDDLENPSINWFQTFVIIFLALVILVFAVVIFLRLRMIQQQYRSSDERAQGLQRELNDRMEGLQKSLISVRQIGINNTEKLNEVESKQSLISDEQESIHNAITEIRGHIDNVKLNLPNLESDRETDSTIDSQSEVESTIQKTQARIEELARAYRNGEPIDLDDIETPTPSQNVLMVLNWMARAIEEWITELEQSSAANPDLIQTLRYAEQTIKDKLKTIRGESSPSPRLLDLGIDVDTDIGLNQIQYQGNVHVARFAGRLLGYEEGREVDTAEYDHFLRQFIKDRLVNGTARFVPFDQLSEQVDKFLQFVGYEVVPIQIGTTKVDSRLHEIQGSQQIGVESGTIVEVVLPGLRRKTDGEIVQKPVVIRGE